MRAACPVHLKSLMVLFWEDVKDTCYWAWDVRHKILHVPALANTTEDGGEWLALNDTWKIKTFHFLLVTIIKAKKCAMVFEKNANQNKTHQPQCASPYAKKNPVSTDSIIRLSPVVFR